MTIPHLTFAQLKQLLKDHEWELIADTDWETHNRVMFGKDGHSFPVPISDVYYYPYVVRLCMSLDIEPPEEHLRCYRQNEERKAKKAKRGE